jgi:hypothetical protein
MVAGVAGVDGLALWAGRALSTPAMANAAVNRTRRTGRMSLSSPQDHELGHLDSSSRDVVTGQIRINSS